MSAAPSEPLVSPLQLRPVVWAGRLLVGVVILHAAFAAAMFDRLPPRLPVHFGIDGAPDAFASPGLGSWFFLVLVSLGLAAFIGAAGLAMFRIPHRWLNIPRKAAFLALPEGERRAVLGIVAGFTLLLGATACAGLLAVQAAQAAVALGALDGFPVAAPLAIAGAIFAELIVMTVRTSAAIDAAVSRHMKEGR
jgi:hypothetical protein